jgi:hypothetical protein
MWWTLLMYQTFRQASKHVDLFSFWLIDALLHQYMVQSSSRILVLLLSFFGEKSTACIVMMTL